jgi:hypothetical protein
MLTPAVIKAAIISGELVAGPNVATILVFLMNRVFGRDLPANHLDNPGRRHKENISLTSFRRAGGQRLLSIRGWKHTLKWSSVFHMLNIRHDDEGAGRGNWLEPNGGAA